MVAIFFFRRPCAKTCQNNEFRRLPRGLFRQIFAKLLYKIVISGVFVWHESSKTKEILRSFCSESVLMLPQRTRFPHNCNLEDPIVTQIEPRLFLPRNWGSIISSLFFYIKVLTWDTSAGFVSAGSCPSASVDSTRLHHPVHESCVKNGPRFVSSFPNVYSVWGYVSKHK